MRLNNKVAMMATLSLLSISIASSFAADKPRSGGTLTWGVETEPNTLNPQLNGQSKAELILRVAYESLLARKADGSFVPWLAERYRVEDGGKRLHFTLRKDVHFSDGEKFNAHAVAENFRHIQDPAYCAGSSLCALGGHIATVETPDDSTLVITLKDAYSPFSPLLPG
ncbi:hypothetical protein ERHA55_52140 (plasmid) [Erwinia rhapontici]|nr:hypothetical protein ERHA55_52140 [Erwinia rhapontici]